MIELERGTARTEETDRGLPNLELVHIWRPLDPGEQIWRSYCGSKHSHICPESANGDTIAMLSPGSRRCWCGARVCAICFRLWEEANAAIIANS